jgi:phosphohistidine phosphatase SixA
VRSSSRPSTVHGGAGRRYHCPVEPPGITRHRRPFLAPLWVILLGVVLFGGIVWAFYRGASTTVVFVVRPVEKEPGTIEDAPLSPEGEARAQLLAQMFGGSTGSGRVDVIYASNDPRARQTAAPLAERLHRTPIVFSAADAGAAAVRALREHPGGTVLMVVSGPALAQVIDELSGSEAPSAAPEEADLIYIVSVPRFGRAHLVRLRL